MPETLLSKLSKVACSLFICIILTISGQADPSSQEKSFDVVIYGATPAGIAAALNAAKNGSNVALISDTDHIGGMITSGLSNTDFKSFEAVQGTYREFMRRVENHYVTTYGANSKNADITFGGAFYEPHIAVKIFDEMLGEQPRVRILLNHRLQNVFKKDSENGLKRITRLQFFNEKNESLSLSGRVFIDATYEGDLMAQAGVEFRVGRESRREFGELFAGQIYYSASYFSGGRIMPGSTGEGDDHVQCYNFRFCLTPKSENRIPIAQPANYNRAEFLPLVEHFRTGKIKSVVEGVAAFRELPNEKFGINDVLYSPFSIRLLENNAYPNGSPEVRRKIVERYRDYTLGLFYFLQNDLELPENVRAEAGKYGLCRDEFKKTGNFPPLLYVREARRMVGEYVFRESDTQNALKSVRAPLHRDSIAVGDYSLDCHGDEPPNSFQPNITGGAFNYPTVPFQIPYRSILPKNIDNLLVPVAMSATHVGFSAVRMEPTWTALGQAAGVAASLSIKQNKSVKTLEVAGVQKLLHESGAITFYFSDVPPGSRYFQAAQYFGNRGFFHDLVDKKTAKFTLGKQTRGQYREAAPNHFAELEKQLGENLAQNWMSRLTEEEFSRAQKNGILSRPDQNLNRGDFLLSLYKAIEK